MMATKWTGKRGSKGYVDGEKGRLAGRSQGRRHMRGSCSSRNLVGKDARCMNQVVKDMQ